MNIVKKHNIKLIRIPILKKTISHTKEYFNKKERLNMNENKTLIFKWLPSENTSSQKTRELAMKTRKAFGMTSKQYRKMLSWGRKQTKILERYMSANQWDQIDFSKIPSKAGFIYKNAFARHDVERMMKATAPIQSYKDFAKDETKTVNAKDLYPYEIVGQAIDITKYSYKHDTTNRDIVNKYWDNYLKSFDDFTFNGIAVVDTSASMLRYGDKSQPMNVAISLGLCCAEKARGPFHNHFITFSANPQLIKVEGVDFVDKVKRIYSSKIFVKNTNIKGVFDLLLKTARENFCSQEEIPENIIIISDMEFDSCASPGWRRYGNADFPAFNRQNVSTELEKIAEEWMRYGYRMPKLIFWNTDARQNNIPMIAPGASFVSGMSPSIYQTIATGKTDTI